ncbi:MAG: hypothetical protein ACE5KD_04515 [Candidatus Bathyarchaeia archaeon]
MNRRSMSVVLAYIVLSSALGLSGYLYFDLDKKHTALQLDHNSLVNKCNLLQSNYNRLELDYQTLNNTNRILVNDYSRLNQTHQILIFEYNELNASYRVFMLNYTELKQDYDELSVNYTMLEQNYTDLSNEYVVLQGQYTGLFNDYNALLEAFNEPLSYEEIPSTYELEQWLAIDETDKIQYDEPDFVCGDFSVMLSLHAKMKHWDIGVVGVFGYNETYESFAHAFNAMISTEGLVYVEPQTDEVWWYTNHEEITEGKWLEFPDSGYIYVEDYIVILWYD